MSTLKLFNVVGARPQFVKAAVVSRALRQHASIQEVIVHSGQHSDAAMSQVFFDELGIPAPDFNLGVAGTGSEAVVGEMESKMVDLIRSEKPDWVLVYGDTYTTRAAAQAAHRCSVALAHVEAGLRSFNPEMPEELNRIVADRLSSVLFAPTQRAVDQLWDEGLGGPEGKVLLSGDVMKDAARIFASNHEPLQGHLPIPDEPFILCTLHRKETTGNREKLRAVVDGLNRIAEQYPIVLPLHPGTKKQMQQFGLHFNFETIPPQGYLTMLALLRKSALVVTDSGGLQKEAYFMQRFCVTLRGETEWTELVDAGYNFLAGTDEQQLFSGVQQMLGKSEPFDEAFYGDGYAAEEIAGFFARKAEEKSNRSY